MAKISGIGKTLVELLIVGVLLAALLPTVIGVLANISLSDPTQALLVGFLGTLIVIGVFYKIYKMAVGSM